MTRSRYLTWPERKLRLLVRRHIGARTEGGGRREAAQEDREDALYYADVRTMFAERMLVRTGIILADIVSGPVLLLAFGLMAAFGALAIAAIFGAVCLIGGFAVAPVIPAMPYWCGALFGVALAALSVVAAAVSRIHYRLTRHGIRRYARYRKNITAELSGRADRQSAEGVVPVANVLDYRLRAVALGSLAACLAFLAAGFLVCGVTAGTPEFWSAWHWFG